MQLHDSVVHKFLDDCYSSGIKDPVRFLIDKMPRVYGFLRGAFPRNILPTDIDGEVEINGHFLRLEFKHEKCLRDGRIPRGQAMCFRSLLETGRFTIFYAGHNSMGEVTCLQIWTSNNIKVLDPCDMARFYLACANWAKYAEKAERKAA
jgi:hypothetical protein